MITSELLSCELTSLIRTYDEDAVADATALAARMLAPVKSELDKATHRFSTELFVTSTLYLMFEGDSPTLKGVLDCIVDQKWESEQKMLAHHPSSRINTLPDVYKTWDVPMFNGY